MKQLIAKIKDLFSKKKFHHWISSLEDHEKNRDILIFFIFLLISTGFWFFNALRDDYTSQFSYPVRFVNIPDSEILIGSSVQRIQIRVRANGYTLLRQYLGGSLRPVTYDVGQLRRINRNNQTQGYVITNDQQASLHAQLLVGMELLEIMPDTIFIQLDELTTKTIPVQLTAKIEFEKQFLLAGDISVKPESIEVSGPRSIIDTLQYIPTKGFTTDRLRDTLRKRVHLLSIEKLDYNHSSTEVLIPVEPFSEQTLSVPIEVTGLPDSLRIKTFPPEINVTFRAGLSQFEKIHFSDFRLTVDGEAAMRPDRPPRLRVRMVETPDNIQSVNYSPLFVEYLIERRR